MSRSRYCCRYVLWVFHIRAISTLNTDDTPHLGPGLFWPLNRNLSFQNESAKTFPGSGFGGETQNETQHFPLILEIFLFWEKRKFSETVKYQNLKTSWGIPSDLIVSGRRNAIPCQIEPAKRPLMRRAPPRSSAKIQTCFIMYPWQASFPRGRKCEKKHSAAGSSEPKTTKTILEIYI